MTDGLLRPSEADAIAAWAALVDADAAQVARVREPEPPGDFYAPMAERSRPGPRAALELPLLEAHARPDDTWLDIGAGGGRFAIPLSRRVARVVAIEPSEAMRATLASAATEAGRTNIEVHDPRWPAAGWTTSADVSLAAHSIYDIREIAPFLDRDGTTHPTALHRSPGRPTARRSARTAVRGGASRTARHPSCAPRIHRFTRRAWPSIRRRHRHR
ncbi:MAG: class I SAM-dependent methyltransferase [Chloroflexi bacterium]|nr:class I SAM-dependent methyltransferase [Chloroflexota bacterium]